MLTLSELYQHILWISVPLFFSSVASLFYCIRSLIRSVRQAQILDIPLMERQEIEFAKAGPVILSIEGPLFTTRFGGLSYELSKSDGTSTQGRSIIFRNRWSGFSRVKMDLMTFRIPESGRYIVKVDGLGASRERDAEHRLVFSIPHLASSIGYVIGITLSPVFLICSLVFTLLRLTEWAGEYAGK